MATLKEIGNKLLDQIKDAAEIEVFTFTGEVTTAILDPSGGKIDFTKLKIDPTGANKLSLVAATWVQIDGDRTEFRSGTASDALLKLHAESVNAAEASRRALAESILGLAKSLM